MPVKNSEKDKAPEVPATFKTTTVDTQSKTAPALAANAAATTNPNAIPYSASTRQTLQSVRTKSHARVRLNHRQQPCSDTKIAAHRQQFRLRQMKPINRQRHIQTDIATHAQHPRSGKPEARAHCRQ